MGSAFHRYADFSDERRATVRSMLADPEFRSAKLSPGARLLYAVSGLMCDETGTVKRADLDHAMADPSIVQCARNLLREAGF